MNKKDLAELAGHIRDGIKLAQAVADEVGETGERNNDRIYFTFPRTRHASIEISGIDYYRYGSAYVLNTNFGGAANNALAILELLRYLQGKGYNPSRNRGAVDGCPELQRFADRMEARMNYSTPQFLAELVKALPGYKWVVTRTGPGLQAYLKGTGRLNGSRRSSILEVERTLQDNNRATWRVRSHCSTKNAEWLGEARDETLLSALRSLQDQYESKAALYLKHASDIELGRVATEQQ